MCKTNEEQTSHLFSLCPYAGDVYILVTQKLSNNRAHDQNEASLEHQTHAWWKDERVCCYDSFLALFIYSI